MGNMVKFFYCFFGQVWYHELVVDDFGEWIIINTEGEMRTYDGYKKWIKRVNYVANATGYATAELLEKADGDACRATEWVCRLIGETDENGELVLTALTDELLCRFLACQGNEMIE